VQKLTEKKNM